MTSLLRLSFITLFSAPTIFGQSTNWVDLVDHSKDGSKTQSRSVESDPTASYLRGSTRVEIFHSAQGTIPPTDLKSNVETGQSQAEYQNNIQQESPDVVLEVADSLPLSIADYQKSVMPVSKSLPSIDSGLLEVLNTENPKSK